ncbi:unnamed protein product [Schistosoma mattheei]|uniref:Uncharacterized protein n=1 Tax=Schistosoma mattheei TaxID=31246 RepID=A0A183NKL8_9TREM|nr:unnamed protein product [Schistosoma mattheei]
MTGSSRQETLDLGFVLIGTRQQGVPVIMRELILPDGFHPVSSSFTVRDVTTELSGSRLTSCRTEMYLQLTDHRVVINIMYVMSFLMQIESYRLRVNENLKVVVDSLYIIKFIFTLEFFLTKKS